MGEVWAAWDSRLERPVALKVLPAGMASDPDRLRRFETESRAAGGLNHPNVLSVYDVGTVDGSPYLVSERLEGETLRQRLRSAPHGFPASRALDWALQLARGLAAAHEKGVVHRDLKPENLFVTKDQRLKILDFGIAKVTALSPENLTSAPTTPSPTEPGTVLGTAGYMSPEQVRGGPVDARSDLFSFGAIVYELLTGRRAFGGPTAVETMNAVLHAEPPPLPADRASPAVERVLRRCLEKDPEERFRSARDVAFALEALSGPASGPWSVPTPRPAVVRAARLLSAAALVGTIGFVAGLDSGSVRPPVFTRLTFARGFVGNARLAPDGRGVVYSASWDGRYPEVFQTAPGGSESRPLGLGHAALLAVSPRGELALQGRVAPAAKIEGLVQTIAVAPLGGGTAKEVLDSAYDAEWMPGGSLAAVRLAGKTTRFEAPIGTPLFESEQYLKCPRFSRDGKRVALWEVHPTENQATVVVLDLASRRLVRSGRFGSPAGLAWSPDGEKVWFSGAGEDGQPAFHAMSRDGATRVVARLGGWWALHDVGSDGRVVASRVTQRKSAAGRSAGDAADRNISWLDATTVRAISADGKTVLFSETGDGARSHHPIAFLRALDGAPATRIGDGLPVGLSPDGKWVLVRRESSRLVLLPTGAGSERVLEPGPIKYVGGGPAFLLPDGKTALYAASEDKKPLRVWVQPVDGLPKALGPEGFSAPVLERSGSRVVARAIDGGTTVFRALSVPAGETLAEQRVTTPGAEGVEVSADGKSLLVLTRANDHGTLHRLDLATGTFEKVREVWPDDPASVALAVSRFVSTPDGSAWAYTTDRILSDLYLVEGLR